MALQRLPLQPCKLEQTEAYGLCGSLSVFENRQTNAGRRIDLHVVVVPARTAQPQHSPIFILDGGPGMPASQAAGLYATVLADYYQSRDVVLVDQRGTGRSHPLTYDFSQGGAIRRIFGEMYPPDLVDDARARLGAIADLTQYTTLHFVEDLEEVRRWLGYEQIDLFGVSYGTRVALTYMRQHPQAIRSAILIGVAPTTLRAPLHHASDAQHALDLLFEECAADPECRRAFPNLRTSFATVLTTIESQPPHLTYVDPMTEKESQFTLHPAAWLQHVRRFLYTPLMTRRLPLIIARAADGDYTPFLKLVLSSGAGSSPLADGLYLSVSTSEDTLFSDLAEARELSKESSFGPFRFEQQYAACRRWPRGQVPDWFLKPISVDQPVLIISGAKDPVTPPRLGAEVAADLPHSRHEIVPHMAHFPVGIIGLSNMEVIDKLAVHYFDHLTSEGFDLKLLGQMLPPPFVIDDADLIPT